MGFEPTTLRHLVQWDAQTTELLACEQALVFGRENARASGEAARGRGLSRLLSRASRASAFHAISQMDSFLAGY